jgi:hypothetical protein
LFIVVSPTYQHHGQGQHGQQRIHPVEDAAMARQQSAGVFDARAALDQGLHAVQTSTKIDRRNTQPCNRACHKAAPANTIKAKPKPWRIPCGHSSQALTPRANIHTDSSTQAAAANNQTKPQGTSRPPHISADKVSAAATPEATDMAASAPCMRAHSQPAAPIRTKVNAAKNQGEGNTNAGKKTANNKAAVMMRCLSMGLAF